MRVSLDHVFAEEVERNLFDAVGGFGEVHDLGQDLLGWRDKVFGKCWWNDLKFVLEEGVVAVGFGCLGSAAA